MGSLYYDQAATWLRNIGLTVVEPDGDGWKRRARSSGGFSNPPLGIQWHHTASKTAPENDWNYQVNGSGDSPIGNATIMRDGSVWMVAAGAANTAGKGGPLPLSRGTVPLDSGNSTTWAFEVANNGVGEAWPQVQVDAYFAASNEMNRHFGNLPSDVFTHALGNEGTGWTDRKIDPATASAIQGPWRPRSMSSSGTWSLADIRAECWRRNAWFRPGPNPPDTEEPPPVDPPPTPEPEIEMPFLHIVANNPDGSAAQGPCIIGPGYWHYARNADEAYVWFKMWGPPRVVDNTYDFDTLVRTLALEPDDGTVVGPGA